MIEVLMLVTGCVGGVLIMGLMSCRAYLKGYEDGRSHERRIND